MAASRLVAGTLLQSELPGLALVHRGKVRDVFDLGDGHLLIVATDRLSAFDVVLPDPIPGKGAMLTRISNFWFGRTAHLMRNHLSGIDVASVLPPGTDPDPYLHRAVVAKKLKPVPVEAIARGYLIGSGWKDYQRTGRVSGIALPDGLRLAEQVRDATLRLYQYASDHAAARGILLADTKFEFGTDADGRLHVMDEMLTPDSSRYWPADEYRVGTSPPSYDKQIVRDYLETLDWDKTAPGPRLPPEVIERTRARYAEALQRLAGIE